MIVTLSFRAEIPEGVDPDDITIMELADLIIHREVHPLADLPWVTVDDRQEESRKLAAARAGVR